MSNVLFCINLFKDSMLFFIISLIILQCVPSNPFVAFAQPINQTIANRPPPTEPPEFQGLTTSKKAASTNNTCMLSSTSKLHGTPQQTEGPYFVDAMPNRSDIRADTLNGVLEKGIRLDLIIHVYRISNGLCTPLKGAKVDIWHANSQGVYSAVSDMGTTKSNFLRGYQITDDNGTVKFTTVYPGWYQGRAIHIHDKIRTFNGSHNNLGWTSQIYFNNSMNEQIHKLSPYSNHGAPQTSDEQDMIFTGPSTDGLVKTNSGKLLLMNVTRSGENSYQGEFNIILNTR